MIKIRCIYLFIIFFCCKGIVQCQDTAKVLKPSIVGIWQLNSKTVAAGLRESFRFYNNGRFIYSKSTFDELNPIISFSGKYVIEKTNLKLRVDSVKQLEGYEIVETDPGVQFGVFQLYGGKPVTTKQKNPTFATHNFQLTDSKSDLALIIDNSKFYRISKDPE